MANSRGTRILRVPLDRILRKTLARVGKSAARVGLSGAFLIHRHYGGQVPLPTLIVNPRLTVVPNVALTVPTCFVATGEVVTLKAGLTV